MKTKDNHKVNKLLMKFFLIRDVGTLYMNEIRTKVLVKTLIIIGSFIFFISSFGILGGTLFSIATVVWSWAYIG